MRDTEYVIEVCRERDKDRGGDILYPNEGTTRGDSLESRYSDTSR